MSSISVKSDPLQQIVGEALGTLLLVVGVVGSGIMAQHLTNDGALALLCNTLATAAILAVLILMFAPVSGAQFNPAVSLALLVRGEISASRALLSGAAQIFGGIGGTIVAHAMFALPLFATGTSVRTGLGQLLGEAVATGGLLLTIFGCRQRGDVALAGAVGLYIGAAYWFTASTSFANPAVTIARAFTPSFAGIRPVDAVLFVVVQLAVAPVVAIVSRWLFAPSLAQSAE